MAAQKYRVSSGRRSMRLVGKSLLEQNRFSRIDYLSQPRRSAHDKRVYNYIAAGGVSFTDSLRYNPRASQGRLKVVLVALVWVLLWVVFHQVHLR